MKDRILAFISIANKAGKVASGEFATETAVKSGKAKLVIVASDASENTKKFFNDKCRFYSVKCIEYGTKEQLGRACGKDFRSNAAILDKGFGDNILRLIAEVEI